MNLSVDGAPMPLYKYRNSSALFRCIAHGWIVHTSLCRVHPIYRIPASGRVPSWAFSLHCQKIKDSVCGTCQLLQIFRVTHFEHRCLFAVGIATVLGEVRVVLRYSTIHFLHWVPFPTPCQSPKSSEIRVPHTEIIVITRTDFNCPAFQRFAGSAPPRRDSTLLCGGLRSY